MVCYRSFEEVQSLREQWDSLVERLDGDIFSSFDWCFIWWKYFGEGRQLEIYIATSGDEIVAVLPLFREMIHWGPFSLRVIRMIGSDHCGARCNLVVDHQYIIPVTNALMKNLDCNGGWDVFHIGYLLDYFQTSQSFVDALQHCEETGRVDFNDNVYTNMVFNIPDTFEKYLKNLSLKERRNIRRDERQLKQMVPVVSHQPVDKSELNHAFSRLISLHYQYWLGRGKLGHFGDWPKVEQFHRDLAEVLLDKGRLVFVEVLTNGKLQATEYGVRFGKRVHWIIGARSQNTTSRIGFCALLRLAIQMGATQIDALIGHYDYKRRLGAKVTYLKAITVFPRNRTSYLRFHLFKCVTWLICLVYFRIWFWRFAPFLRRKSSFSHIRPLRAGLWKRYIRTQFLVEGNHSARKVEI